MDVLILSVSTGGGHMKAADAIKDEVELKYPGSRVSIIDTLKYLNPVFDKLIVGSYLNTVKKTPKVYGILYELSEWGENISALSKFVNSFLSARLKVFIDEFNPSIIVCTHTFPLQMLSSLKRAGKVNIPVMAIITDFVTHPFWVCDNMGLYVDAYIVAHEQIKYEMISRGVSPEIVYPLGIPISKDFVKRKNRANVLKELGLDNKMTALVMGGSLGLGEMYGAFSSLLSCKRDLQVIAVTGKNFKLKNQLESLCASTGKKIRIFSYTDRVPDFMDASDFLITKPGGLTISEALVKELPIFIISPIPGQEEKNSQFLINNGAAANISDTGFMESILHQVMDNPLRLVHMKEMARHLSRPNSTDDIVELMASLCGQKGIIKNTAESV